ncbi:amidohydrolase [Bacillus sp. FJAT-47783]|uniref:M20 metallopeptidase family protein n=1 Tax=Bacillus sp. FJAT-47783 TaxID=2922712 RepID=UPI001FADC459|nr:amidohydrolase [Bacillus sp. FJAT-47783]
MTTKQKIEEWVILQRRYFHQYPELSHQEVETKKYVEKQLTKLGLRTYSLTGKDVVAVLEGNHPGKTVAIRADMDALPIKEETNLPFASKHDGAMHACGHDGHMAILLGIAKTFVEAQEEIHGTILFIFQHAEESVPGGAKELVSKNILDGVDAIFGYHLWQPLSTGMIGIREGSTMAGADRFSCTIYGKGGHGSMPNETVDPTLIAAHAITQMHSIVSRSLHPLEQAVLSLGEIRAGSTYNVIPDTAYMSGTVRHFHESISKQVRSRIEMILDGVCKSFGATYEFDHNHGDPPVINDKKLVQMIRTEAETLYGKTSVMTIDPVLGSEDFSYYSKEIPAVYTFIGVGNSTYIHGHHHPKFDFDEQMLIRGVELISTSVLRYLKECREDEN